MQRDMDLIRQILLTLERDTTSTHRGKFAIAGVDTDRVAYHVKLLMQAGLVEATEVSLPARNRILVDCVPESLTWQGHEFLDATRDDTRWRQIKAKLGDAALSAPLVIIQELALKLMRSTVGLP